jgi:hypothetical protein
LLYSRKHEMLFFPYQSSQCDSQHSSIPLNERASGVHINSDYW